MATAKEIIESGKAVMGLELGSTRIKAVLIGEDKNPIASGSHEWENRYENGIWTYHLADIHEGVEMLCGSAEKCDPGVWRTHQKTGRHRYFGYDARLPAF